MDRSITSPAHRPITYSSMLIALTVSLLLSGCSSGSPIGPAGRVPVPVAGSSYTYTILQATESEEQQQEGVRFEVYPASSAPTSGAWDEGFVESSFIASADSVLISTSVSDTDGHVYYGAEGDMGLRDRFLSFLNIESPFLLFPVESKEIQLYLISTITADNELSLEVTVTHSGTDGVRVGEKELACHKLTVTGTAVITEGGVTEEYSYKRDLWISPVTGYIVKDLNTIYTGLDRTERLVEFSMVLTDYTVITFE